MGLGVRSQGLGVRGRVGVRVGARARVWVRIRARVRVRIEFRVGVRVIGLGLEPQQGLRHFDPAFVGRSHQQRT